MKKKFILLAMMLLTLIGGVNLNVLNAQEDVVTINGDATSYSNIYPISFNYNYSLSQHTYTASEINHAAGVVDKIAFKVNVTQTRNLTLYLQNTTIDALSSWVSFTDEDKVYSNSSVNTAPSDGWLIIDVDDFYYDGTNILLTSVDNTGSSVYTWSAGSAFLGNAGRNATLYLYDNNNPISVTSSTPYPSTRQPALKLYFAEQTDNIVPAAPTNLVATTVDYKSVNLTWDADENALRYQVWQGENMIAETDQTEYLVEGLSDGTEYCFTVKSVRYNNNTSDASSESCATTAVLPVPGTPVNLAATNITHNSVTLTWDDVEYAESYTVSYTDGTITVTENTCDVTGLTPETDYTFSVTANNIKGSSSAAEVSATTLEYNDPFAGKLFRIKVNSGNANGQYLNIFSYNKNSATNMSSVGVKAKADTEYQKFIIESAGNGNYYLKNTAGYYIKCAEYNVDAFSTTEKTALTFEYVSGSDGPFYLRDSEYTGGKTDNYFKAEYAYGGDFAYNYHVYCNQPITNTYVVTWTLEEVVLSATATTEPNSIYDDQTTTLSVTAMDGSGNYTYSWSPAEGLSDATSANPTFSPATTGEHTFTCTVTDTESNATTEASVTVYVYARPTLYFTVYADKELIYNDGETAVLTAIVTENTGYAPYTYSWTLNETEVGTEATYTFSNETVGEYTLTCTVTDARNNTQTASKTIEVKDASERPKTRNIVFTLKDSFGDTWNGGYLTVTATDGTNESLQMLTGSYSNRVYEEQYTLQIAEGAVVTVTFTPGSYSSECSYCIDYEYGDNIVCSATSGLVDGNRIYYFTVESSIPKVNYILVQDEEGNNLEDVVMVDTRIILSWPEVEGSTSYKVYKQNYLGEDEPLAIVETITYAVYAEHDVNGVKFGVSALFGDDESDIVYTSLIKVIGEGVIKGKVTDGVNPIADALIRLEGTSLIGEEIFPDIMPNEFGEFEYSVTEGTYTLSVSHYDYEGYVSENNVEIDYGMTNDLGIIVLTAKPTAEGVEVEADNTGYVSWTGDYTKWNVYRRNVEEPQELETVATELTTTSTTDAAWETLEPGTYQYGVAGFVEGGTEIGVQLSENFDDGVMPEGWTTTSATDTYEPWTWYIRDGAMFSPYRYSGGDATIYLITPLISTENAVLTFKYKNKYWSNTSRNDFYVRYATSPEGPWTGGDYLYYSQYQTDYTDVTIDLNTIEADQVYIAFCNTNVEYGADGIYLDDIVITGEVTSETETQIVWSNEVVKQGPATFIGGDTGNPTAWNVDANWSTGSVPADGADVIINADAVISSEVNVASITINNGDSYPYNTLTVADKGILTVTGTISQQSDYLLVLEEGGQIFQNNANVTARFRMSIDNPSDWSDETNKDGWQFISMPMTGVDFYGFASTWNSSTAQPTCDYDLYKYDGSQEKEWQNFRDGGFEEDTFKSGTGYLASRKEVSTVSLSGALNVETPFAFSGYDQIIYNEEKDLANFRLFGNPFTYDIYMSDFDLDLYNDGENDFVSGYAVVNNSGSYDYRTIEPIKVGEGFFVKALTTTAIAYAPASKRSENKSDNSLNITATGNAGKDNVVINLAGKSEGFNKLQNFNDAIATVYVAEDGKNYGIYNCDADVQEIELNFNANQMGNYTISIQPNGKFQTVTLVDRFTGIETNMLLEDYSFTAMSNENNNRFIVKLAVSDQQSAVSDNFVYQSGEDLIIDAEGTVQIIDVMGRVLLSDEVESTNNRINVSSFRNGTYMVRVINGSEVKVEKVVIY